MSTARPSHTVDKQLKAAKDVDDNAKIKQEMLKPATELLK